MASNDETSLTSLGRVSSITFPEIVLVFAAPFRDISSTRNVTCSFIVLQERPERHAKAESIVGKQVERYRERGKMRKNEKHFQDREAPTRSCLFF